MLAMFVLIYNSLLKLAWAVTIHKAQGLTLNQAVVSLGNKEFSAGLTFIAYVHVCSNLRTSAL